MLSRRVSLPGNLYFPAIQSNPIQSSGSARLSLLGIVLPDFATKLQAGRERWCPMPAPKGERGGERRAIHSLASLLLSSTHFTPLSLHTNTLKATLHQSLTTMSVSAFLAKNTVLWPLIAVVGAGVSACIVLLRLSVAVPYSHASHLSHSPSLHPVSLAYLASCTSLAPRTRTQIGGSVAFGGYYLSNSPDVVVNKKIKDPWNNSE